MDAADVMEGLVNDQIEAEALLLGGIPDLPATGPPGLDVVKHLPDELARVVACVTWLEARLPLMEQLPPYLMTGWGRWAKQTRDLLMSLGVDAIRLQQQAKKHGY